jgi:hypothetical protein
MKTSVFSLNAVIFDDDAGSYVLVTGFVELGLFIE